MNLPVHKTDLKIYRKAISELEHEVELIKFLLGISTGAVYTDLIFRKYNTNKTISHYKSLIKSIKNDLDNLSRI